MQNVIVFGPTGAVGCAAAREARRRGLSVWLAMRDTSKTIPGIDISEAGYTRVQADLSAPSSLTHAVHKSSATTAFVYTIFASPDHMASSFAALKSAGITYIVLLSSFKVEGDAQQHSNMDDFVAREHAQTEVALDESGMAYTAVRPAYFSSNVLWNLKELKQGEVGILYSGVQFDFIAPSDIGIVCGRLLAESRFRKGKQGQPCKSLYLCGPELLSQRRAHEIMAQVLDREINVKEISEESWLEKHSYMPKPALEALLNGLRKSHEGHNAYPADLYEKAVDNIRTFKEAEPMKFSEWVEGHKAVFA